MYGINRDRDDRCGWECRSHLGAYAAKPRQRRWICTIRCSWECRSHLGAYAAKPHLPYLRMYGEVGKPRLPGGGPMFGKNVRWICRESEFPPTEERDASVKTFEFTRVICYDVSGVERIYQFLLQCLQSDVYAAADNFRGCRALLLLDRSEGT